MTGTLAQLLESRRVTMDAVVGWSAAIAAELSTLHASGRVHGAIAAESILVQGDSVRLAPAAPKVAADQSGDIGQFAALLRRMIEAAPVDTEKARTQWSALDAIATATSRAPGASRMKKVALRLRLLRFTRSLEAPSPAPATRRTAVLMLVREVPPAASAKHRRFVVKTVHVGAFLASAASIAVAVGIFVLKLVR